MSRLDELIRELCPNGVPFVRIQDCCALEKGKTPIQKAIPGEYPLVVTTAERKTANTYQFDKPSVCIPLVSSRGHGVASLNEVFYQEGKFALGNILCAVTPLHPDRLSAKFLHVYLNYAKDTLLVPKMKGGANVSLSVDAIGRCKIPVPPIEVQREIVRILDKFTELSVELSAELSARQRQYSYYRTYLLSINGLQELCPNAVEYYPLANVCKFMSGFAFKASTFKTDGVPVCKTTNIQNNEILFEGMDCINPTDYSESLERYRVYPQDIVIGMSGTIKVGINNSEHCCYLNQRVGKFSPDRSVLHNRFLYYILCSSVEDLANGIIGGSVKNLSNNDVLSLSIPIPPIEVQQEIVCILDKFTKLISELTAEVSARQKQHEYYRDKLLTFKPLA